MARAAAVPQSIRISNVEKTVRGKDLIAKVREFCKKNRICPRCFRRTTERGKTRCRTCNRLHAKAQRVRLRRNYERDVAAGICVRCHTRRATPTNKRCKKCQERHAEQKRGTSA